MKQQNINKVVQAMRLLASEDVQETYLKRIHDESSANWLWGEMELPLAFLDLFDLMDKSGYQWNGVMWVRKPQPVRVFTGHRCGGIGDAFERNAIRVVVSPRGGGSKPSVVVDVSVTTLYAGDINIEYCPFCGAKLFEMRMEGEEDNDSWI